MDNCNVREKIFFVDSSNLDEVNKELKKKGARVKSICPVARHIELDFHPSELSYCRGNIFAYVVIEYND